MVPFGSETFYHPVSIKEKNRLHQLSKKDVNSIFIGHALNAAGGGRLDGRPARGKCRRIEEQQCFRSPRHSYFHVLTVQWNEQIMVRIIIPPTLVRIGFTGFTWWYLARGMPQNFQRQAKQPWDTDKQTQGRRCTPSDRHLLHFVGWWKNLTPWSKNTRRKLETHMESTMCKAERKSAKKWIMLCQPAGWNRVQKHSWENLTNPTRKVKYRCLCSQNGCLWISMPYQRKRQTKGRRAYCRPRTQFNESLQIGSFAATFFKKRWKNLEGKAAVDKEWGNLTDVPA